MIAAASLQITDDSELALALGAGLSQHDPATGFPEEAVAQQYGIWLKSNPFDVGEQQHEGVVWVGGGVDQGH